MILLVEDNPDDEALAVRALKKQRVPHEAVVVARDGVEAIEYLLGSEHKPPGKLPRLILLDLKLPKMDGLEVLRKVRSSARTKFLPVVVLTSSMEERDLVESYSLGTNSYVQKPIDFLAFSEAVRQLGLYWLVLNQTPPAVDG